MPQYFVMFTLFIVIGMSTCNKKKLKFFLWQGGSSVDDKGDRIVGTGVGHVNMDTGGGGRGGLVEKLLAVALFYFILGTVATYHNHSSSHCIPPAATASRKIQSPCWNRVKGRKHPLGIAFNCWQSHQSRPHQSRFQSPWNM